MPERMGVLGCFLAVFDRVLGHTCHATVTALFHRVHSVLGEGGLGGGVQLNHKYQVGSCFPCICKFSVATARETHAKLRILTESETHTPTKTK
jgi:hypothetical protein